MKPFICTTFLRHPKRVIAVCLTIFFIALGGISQLKNDPNPEILPTTHPSRIAHETLKNDYTGNKDLIVIMLKHPQNVFNPETLRRIPKLTKALAKIDTLTQEDLGFISQLIQLAPAHKQTLEKVLASPTMDRTTSILVEVKNNLASRARWNDKLESKLIRFFDHARPITNIHSLYDTDNIFAHEGDIIVKPIYTQVPINAHNMSTLENEVRSNALFKHLLISEDGKSTGIYLELNLRVEDASATQLLLNKVQRVIDNTPGTEEVFIAGMPVTTATISQVIDADMGRLFPLVLLIVLLILWVTFRDLKGLLLPVSVVIFSLVSTLAIMAYAGISVNIITASLPVFLISIGIADGVHFYAEYRTQFHLYQDKHTALKKTLDLLIKPITLTSITTAIAFFSLTYTEIQQIALFGTFVGIGTLLAMIFSLTLLPALILALPEKAIHRKPGKKRLAHLLTSVPNSTSTLITQHPGKIVLLACAILIGAVLGATSAQFDNNRVKFFEDNSALVTSVENIRSALAGSEVLNISIHAAQDLNEAMKAPATLKFIDDLENYATSLNHVGTSMSLAKLVRRMNLVMHENDPRYDAVPELADTSELKNLISQYIFLYENSGGDLLSDVVTSDYAQSNIKLYLRTNSSTDIQDIIRDITQYSQLHMPAELSLSFAGNGNLLVAAGDEIILGQMNSLILCFMIVVLLLIIQFKSFSFGLLGFIPLALAVVINFGILGFLGVNIDIGTAIVSSIAIGIGVDYSIHYLCRYKLLVASNTPKHQAITGAVVSAGRAITYNACTVGIAFLALLMSGFVPIQSIGWLVSISLAVSCIAALIVVPAVMQLFLPSTALASTKLASKRSGTTVSKEATL